MKLQGVLHLTLGILIISLAMIPAFIFTDYHGRPLSGEYSVAETEAILIDSSRADEFENDGSYREVAENAPSLSDGQTAAFFRRSEEYGDLLIVMNLSPQTIEKDLGKTGKGFRLSEELTANGESIKYKSGILSLPAYSIALFAADR